MFWITFNCFICDYLISRNSRNVYYNVVAYIIVNWIIALYIWYVLFNEAFYVKSIVLLNIKHYVINLNLIFLIYDFQRSLSSMCKSKILIFVFNFVIVVFKFIVINILNRLKLRVKYINLYFFKTKVISYIVVYRKYILYALFKIE